MSANEDKAQTAKAEGTKAWQAGNFPQAIKHFSEAIDSATPSNKEFLKILYSNRSAAWLKVGKASEALTDGEKCVSLDNQWTKGYTRKGDALYQLKRYTEAYNAYNSGLRIDGNDSTLKEKVEQAMRAIRNESSSSSTSSSSNTSSRPNTSTSNGATLAVTGQVRLAKMAVIVLGFVYLIPFLGSINNLAYRASAGLYAGLSILALYQKYGMPKFSTEYAAQVFPDPAMMRVFLGSFLAFSVRPYFFALVPAMLTEMTSFTNEIFQVMTLL
jgi:tetratricopeptide (TPR) repeat protein